MRKGFARFDKTFTFKLLPQALSNANYFLTRTCKTFKKPIKGYIVKPLKEIIILRE